METSETKYEQNGEREKTTATNFIVRFWNFAKNKNFASLVSRPQRTGMTSPLRKLLANCFKTFSGLPEDWTVTARAMSTLKVRLRPTHTLRGSVLGGLCKPLHKRMHLRDTHKGVHKGGWG